MAEDIVTYYNRESELYSKKRYEGKPETYVKYFFKKRLSFLLKDIERCLAGKEQVCLLDVGCADGYVVQEIDTLFPKKFKEIIGVDIAPQMINEAIRANNKSYISFFSRDDERQNQRFDIILEVGFLSPSLFEHEFEYVMKRLDRGGYYICSLTSKNSLHAWLKLRGKKGNEYIDGYLTYAQYEHILSKDFEILSKDPCGLFIPKLWAFPTIARVLQPFLDGVFRYVIPNAFHEKLYLLRKR